MAIKKPNTAFNQTQINPGLIFPVLVTALVKAIVGTNKMNGIIKIIIGLILLVPSICFAGGDAVSGLVKSIESKGDTILISFIEDDGQSDLNKNCKEYKINVKYSRVPWFSWLPFIKSSHPSKKETEEAIEYLKTAKKNNRTIKQNGDSA